MVIQRAKKVTLSDVAERAGVSRTTASYILGKTRGGFAKETVERVSNAAKELGFRPNPIAQSLRTGRTRLLGLLVAAEIKSPQQYIRYQVDIGVAMEARSHRMDIVQVLISPETGPEIGRISELLDTGLIEGLILNAPRKRNVLPWLHDHGGVFVVIGNPNISGVYSVDTDNVGIGRVTAQHLIDFGHRRLAYIAPPDDLAYGNDRVEGFLMACAEAEISPEHCPVVRAEDTMCGGYRAMQEILSMDIQVTGVCASDDSMGYGAASAISEAGLTVPGDISVVGCNNDYLAGIDQGFLTTVELDFVRLGSAAAAKLIDLLEGKPTTIRDIIDFRLIQRKSSGPVKNCG